MAESRFSGFDMAGFQSQLGNVTQLNQFAANITLPSFLASLFPESDQFQRKAAFSIRAANLPPSTIAEIPVAFRGGQKFRIPGDRDYSGTWDVTLRYDIKNVIGNTMMRWSDSMVGWVDSDSVGSDENVLDYMGVGELHQLSRNGRIITSWNLAGIWPQTVGQPQYDWTADNAIVEIPVTFVMQHVETPVTRNNLIMEEQLLSGSLFF